MVEPNINLPLDAFVRQIKVHSHSPHAVFLGAGASVSSGINSADTCIWYWKSEIYTTNNPGAHRLDDLALPSIQKKIQHWLDEQNGYPPLGSQEEYSFYVERCYPSPAARRQYFENLTAEKIPHVGYQLLCLLAEAQIVRSVWSTNFDQLTARAAASFNITPVEIGLDTSERIYRLPKEKELLCVALHGDYRYDSLKNTEGELLRQDKNLRAQLVHHLVDNSLLVLGYSGRDQSIMETLTEAYSRPGGGILYWCGYGDDAPLLPCES